MMQLTQRVTEEVRAEMARRRLTQQDLADALRWTPGYLSRRLTGEVAWSLDDIEEVAAALQVPPLALLAPASRLAIA